MADIFGTSGDDTLDGTADGDSIFGDTGNDTIDAKGGDDTIDAGAGADHVNGGGGDDTYLIVPSNDFAVGDSFDGGVGYDTIVIAADAPGFQLGDLSYTRVEALVAHGSSALDVTSSQLGAFVAAEGYLRIVGTGSVNLAGVTLGSSILILDPAITSFSFTAATGAVIQIEAGDGGVTINGSISDDVMIGGTGNDTLIGGDGADIFYAGHGIDSVSGGAGDDRFLYGYGNDYPVALAATGDTVSGGAGFDTISFYLTDDDFALGLMTVTGVEMLVSGGFKPLQVTAAQLAQFGEISGLFLLTGSGPVTLGPLTVTYGSITLGDAITSFDFAAANYTEITITGGSGDNVITAGSGTSGIFGAGGSDTVHGGSGSDFIVGGDGNDVLYGNSGNDFLQGDAGRDELYGGDGDDRLNFGALSGDAMSGEIYDGGAGFDTLSMAGAADPSGGIFDITGATVINIEHIAVSSVWATRLTVGQLHSFQTISGALLLADAGPVSLSGRTLQGADITLNNAGQVFDASGASVLLGATVRGGSGADTMTAADYTMKIYGGDGNDVLTGAANGGQLQGEGGNDRLVLSSGGVVHGGDGFDTLVVNGPVWLNSGSNAISGIEAIEVNGGQLRLTGYQFAHGLAPTTVISGNGAILVELDSEVIGGFVTSTNFIGSRLTVDPAISFVVAGTAGTDVVKASLTAAITIDGAGGVDQLRGSNLADVIRGGEGNDKIMGLGGADVLTGGAGADQFRWLFTTDSGLGAAADHITDFLAGTDRIDLRLLDADPGAAGRQSATYIGSSAFHANGVAEVHHVVSGADMLVEVDLDGNGTADMQLVLEGAGGQVLSAGDFLLTL